MRHQLGVHRRTDMEVNGLKRELSPWSALVLARDGDAALSSSSSERLARMQYARRGRSASASASLPGNIMGTPNKI